LTKCDGSGFFIAAELTEIKENSGVRRQNTGDRRQETEDRRQNAECRIQNAKCRRQNTENSTGEVPFDKLRASSGDTSDEIRPLKLVLSKKACPRMP